MKRLPLIILILWYCLPAAGNTDSLLRVAARLRNSDTALANVYTRIGWSYFAANDTASALLYLKKSTGLAEQLKFDKGIMNGASNIAMFYTRFGLIDSALTYFFLCLNKAKEVDDINTAPKACINIASAYLSKANYAEAIQYYLQALQYLEQTNDQEKIAVNYHCLGIAYYMLKNYPLSLKYYRKSLETGVKIGKPDESATTTTA